MKRYLAAALFLILISTGVSYQLPTASAVSLQEVLATSLQTNQRINAQAMQHDVLRLQNYADLVATVLPKMSLYVNTSVLSNFQRGKSIEDFLKPATEVINTLLEEDKAEDDREILCATYGLIDLCLLTIKEAKKQILETLAPTVEESKKRLANLSEGLLGYGRARDSQTMLPLELGLNFSWDIMSIPNVILKQEITSELEQGSLALLTSVSQDELSKTVDLFLNVAFLKQKIDLHKRELLYTQHLLERAETFYQKGVITLEELNLAKLALLAVQEKMVRSLADIKILEEEYKLQVGDLPEIMEVPQEPKLPASLAEAIASMEVFNSELVKLRHEINAAGKEADLAAVNLAPSVNLEAQVSKGWDLKANEASALRWSVGINVNLELLGSVNRTYWSRATSLKKRSMLLAKYRNLRNQQKQRIHEAWFNLETAQARANLALRRQQLQELVLKRNEEKFIKGIISFEDLIESYVKVARSKINALELQKQQLLHSFEILVRIGNISFEKFR